MKKWFLILTVIAIGAAIYYDLSKGTLSVSEQESEAIATDEHIEEQSFEDRDNTSVYNSMDILVEPGQSLLTIVEQLHEDGVHVGVENIKIDFQALNDGHAPDHLQHGEVYTFPIYENQEP